MRNVIKCCASMLLTLLGVGVIACSDNDEPREIVANAAAACTWEQVDDCGSGMYGIKLDSPELGGTHRYDLPFAGGYFIEVTRTNNDAVNWNSNIGVDLIWIKGGDDWPGTEKTYNPESFGDSGLFAPINPKTQQPYGVSHVTFCIDFELVVEKSVVPTFTRTWTWSIDKSASVAELTLEGTGSADVSFAVTLDNTLADSNFELSGNIVVKNPWPFEAIVERVEDELSGIGAIPITCPSMPRLLAMGDELTCTYSTPVADANRRTNTAKVFVTSASMVKGASTTVPAEFGGPTQLVDECVTVKDSRPESMLDRTVCADAMPEMPLTYTLEIGPYECGQDWQFVNTATFVTNDTAATGSDTATILVDVLCDAGCTLTPGYWKNHPACGSAPCDDTWKLLGELAQCTPFFKSGQTYLEVLWTPPKGNSYYILAHAYIAAVLNRLNGASTTAIADTLLACEDWFETATPSMSQCGTTRARLLEWADKLDQYNNGMIGPQHCGD